MQQWNDVLRARSLSRLVRSLGRPGIGLDLGSHHTRCYLSRDSQVRQYASMIALRQHKGRQQVERIGTQSVVLRGRTNTDIRVISPIENGVVAHFDAGRMMLQGLLRSALGTVSQAQGFNTIVAVPTHTSLIERRAVRELLISVGAKSIHTVDTPLAAAIGCGLAVNTPCGRLMIDAGSATTEIAVLSLGGLLRTQTLKVGGNSFNAAIHAHIKRTYGAVVGENTLETIKLMVSEFLRSGKGDSQPVSFIASSLSSGLPLTLRISVGELRELIQPALEHIARAVAQVVEQSPIEIVDDLMRDGATLVGGSALFPDLATVITRRSGVPVNIPKNPMQSVAQGAGRLLQGRVEDGEWLVLPQEAE